MNGSEPAFPQVDFVDGAGTHYLRGMSTREFLAAVVSLSDREFDALLQQATTATGKPMSLAALRYFYADEMLKEREKKS